MVNFSPQAGQVSNIKGFRNGIPFIQCGHTRVSSMTMNPPLMIYYLYYITQYFNLQVNNYQENLIVSILKQLINTNRLKPFYKPRRYVGCEVGNPDKMLFLCNSSETPILRGSFCSFS